MKAIEKMMEIDTAFNDNGGVNFLKIRALFDDIDRLAGEGNINAIQFTEGLDTVYRVIKAAVAT